MALRDYLALRNGTDVRGIASEGVAGEYINLTPGRAENIAAAFCLWLRAKTGKEKVCIAVGHDSRISAQSLSEAALRGVQKAG